MIDATIRREFRGARR